MKPIIETITKDWIDKNNRCKEALVWYKDYLGKSPIVILKRLIKAKKYDWANWFIVRVMEYHDYVSYAVFAAEQVIDIFEKEFPDDNRPREAIESAKKCIKNPSDENKKEAAWSAARAADSASWAADSAAYWSAERAANSAARAVYWVACAADSAACAACAAKATANAKILKKILKYGIELLREGK